MKHIILDVRTLRFTLVEGDSRKEIMPFEAQVRLSSGELNPAQTSVNSDSGELEEIYYTFK